MLQLWDCFTQHLFLQISGLSTSVWEFDVSALNLLRLTSSFGVSTLFLLFEQASHLFPETLLFYPCSSKNFEGLHYWDFKSGEQDFVKIGSNEESPS